MFLFLPVYDGSSTVPMVVLEARTHEIAHIRIQSRHS